MGYIIVIVSSTMLMLMSFAAATAYILNGICAGGVNGMQAFCPVVYMVHQTAGELSKYWDIYHYCDCAKMSLITIESGGVCSSGWQPGAGLQELCNDHNLVDGAHSACMGCILLIVGTVGLIAMSMRTRSRMATKMFENAMTH